MYDICIKRSVKGETTLVLKENADLKEGELIIGYAKAVDTDKSTYFCKDKGLILSPGDVVFLNGIKGWVEIVEFNQKKVEKEETAHGKNSGIKFYNEGVRLFQKNCNKEAIDAFYKCYNAGAYQMQSAYSISLCQQRFEVDVTIPEGLEDKVDSAGTVFIASNLVCKLISDGYQAALTGESSVLTIVDGTMYDIRVVSMLGSVMINAWRKEQNGTVPLSDSSLNPYPSKSDQFVVSLVQEASSLPPYPIPVEGIPSSLEYSFEQKPSFKKDVKSENPKIQDNPANRSGFANKLIQSRWVLGFYALYLLGFSSIMILGELGVFNRLNDDVNVPFIITIIFTVIGLIGSTISAYYHAEGLNRDGGRWGLFVFLFTLIAPLILVAMPESRNR